MSGEQTGPPEPPVLLYDGVCGVCNWAVRTILRFDRRCTLRFAALESDYAQGVFGRHPEIKDVDSVVFVDAPGDAGEQVFVRSAAALRVADYLGGPWKLFKAAAVIPGPLRDRLYDGFAAIRYRVFGKYDTCPVPSPQARARFLES